MQTEKQKKKPATKSTLIEYIRQHKRGRLTTAQLLRLKVQWEHTK